MCKAAGAVVVFSGSEFGPPGPFEVPCVGGAKSKKTLKGMAPIVMRTLSFVNTFTQDFLANDSENKI